MVDIRVSKWYGFHNDTAPRPLRGIQSNLAKEKRNTKENKHEALSQKRIRLRPADLSFYLLGRRLIAEGEESWAMGR